MMTGIVIGLLVVKGQIMLHGKSRDMIQPAPQLVHPHKHSSALREEAKLPSCHVTLSSEHLLDSPSIAVIQSLPNLSTQYIYSHAIIKAFTRLTLGNYSLLVSKQLEKETSQEISSFKVWEHE
jgi:hypothetical protein